MPEWPQARLGDLCSDDPGAIAIGPFGSRMKADCYVERGVPVIRGTNISDSREWKGDWVYVSEETADSMPNCNVRRGDLVFPHRGSIGEVAIVPEEPSRYMLSTSLMKFTVHPKKADALFLFYYLRSPEGRREILTYASQVGTPGIGQPLTSLRQFRVPRPPITVQRAIALVLSALDHKISLNRQMNTTLEAMARGIFKDWFVDFGPTHSKVEGHPAYLMPEVWALFPEMLDENDKPAGWSDKPLSAVIELIGGGTPKTAVAEYWGGPIPWFSVVDAPHPSDVFVLKTEKSVTAAGLASSSARILPLGATIITARGTVGKLAMVGTEMAMNQSCYAVIGKSGWPESFVYFLLKTTVQSLQANTHGSVFDTITRQTFDVVSACCPTPRVAEAFGRSVDSILGRIKSNLQENETLAEMRDFLLPRLMSGQIRLKDAEKKTEEAL